MITVSHIERALRLPGFDGRAAQQRMMPTPRAATRPVGLPGQARQGAVLLLLYPWHNETHLVLTKRPDGLSSHGGQVSLPGGRREPGESLAAAALRETTEEIGVDPAAVRLLGELTPLYILPSDFEVHPFVGWHEGRPAFTAAAHEVEAIIEVPLSYLMDPAIRFEEEWTIRGYTLLVPYFLVADYKVWGATAMMLSEFLRRLNAIGD